MMTFLLILAGLFVLLLVYGLVKIIVLTSAAQTRRAPRCPIHKTPLRAVVEPQLACGMVIPKVIGHLCDKCIAQEKKHAQSSV